MRTASIILITLLTFNFTTAQEDTEKTNGFFYKISLASTLGVNEDFSLVEEENSNLIRPSSLFINNTFGYQFDERSSIGLNIEYDWYWERGFHFLPVHLSFRYNILDFDDKLFLRGGYGRLVGISDDFEKGNQYKLGLGFQIFDEDFKNSCLIGLDFNRKRFGFRQTEKLSSVSIFLEFQFF